MLVTAPLPCVSLGRLLDISKPLIASIRCIGYPLLCPWFRGLSESQQVSSAKAGRDLKAMESLAESQPHGTGQIVVSFLPTCLYGLGACGLHCHLCCLGLPWAGCDRFKCLILLNSNVFSGTLRLLRHREEASPLSLQAALRHPHFTHFTLCW